MHRLREIHYFEIFHELRIGEKNDSGLFSSGRQNTLNPARIRDDFLDTLYMTFFYDRYEDGKSV